MELSQLQASARSVRAAYEAHERSSYGRPWNTSEIMLGFVGDVGDLAQLVQGAAGVRAFDDLDEQIAHELADCLWAVLTLADALDVDLERAFTDTMAQLTAHLAED